MIVAGSNTKPVFLRTNSINGAIECVSIYAAEGVSYEKAL